MNSFDFSLYIKCMPKDFSIEMNLSLNLYVINDAHKNDINPCHSNRTSFSEAVLEWRLRRPWKLSLIRLTFMKMLKSNGSKRKSDRISLKTSQHVDSVLISFLPLIRELPPKTSSGSIISAINFINWVKNKSNQQFLFNTSVWLIGSDRKN